MQINIGKNIQLYRDDCLRRMKTLPDRSIDLVLCDLPYGGVTGCSWDIAINLHAFWLEIKRVLKPSGVVVAFAIQPFTSELVSSNRKWFRYAMVWEKSRPTGFLQSKQRPLKSHEDILVFTRGNLASGKQNVANRAYFEPQGLERREKPLHRKAEHRTRFLSANILAGATAEWTNFPRSILKYASVHKPLHPTQKPVDLLAYLVKSYSRDGNVVLDPTMGAGSAGVAAIAEGRSFIGIEMNVEFFRMAAARFDDRAMRAA